MGRRKAETRPGLTWPDETANLQALVWGGLLLSSLTAILIGIG